MITIDGQVCLVRVVRLQTDNFRLFLPKLKAKEQMTNFRLHDEQTVNGLRKIT
jgi:hypothetical protein